MSCLVVQKLEESRFSVNVFSGKMRLWKATSYPPYQTLILKIFRCTFDNEQEVLFVKPWTENGELICCRADSRRTQIWATHEGVTCRERHENERYQLMIIWYILSMVLASFLIAQWHDCKLRPIGASDDTFNNDIVYSAVCCFPQSSVTKWATHWI